MIHIWELALMEMIFPSIGAFYFNKLGKYMGVVGFVLCFMLVEFYIYWALSNGMVVK